MKPSEEKTMENFDSIAKRLMTELNLFDSDKQRYLKVIEQYQKELDRLNSDEQPVMDYNGPEFKVQLLNKHSIEGRYVIKNYKPIEGRKWYEAFSEEDTEIMAAILRTLPKEELQQFQKYYAANPEYSQIYWRIAESHYVENNNKKQLSINTLLKHYSSGVRGKKGPARLELRNRFDHQSFTDQMKILRLFLDGAKTDREWCYSKLLHWWGQSLSADLEQAWLRYKDQKCVRTAALRLSEDFIKEHEEAMGELDYKSVCGRLARDVSYVIDKSRLSPMDYCFVIAHNHRHISDEEADQLLFGHIEQLFYREEHHGVYPDPNPSLYKFKSVRYMVWTFGETGNAPTIIKFHLWNKTIQKNMPHYQTEDGPRCLWEVFVNIVLHTIPVLTDGYDEYKKPERQSPIVLTTINDYFPPEEDSLITHPIPLTIDDNDPPF